MIVRMLAQAPDRSNVAPVVAGHLERAREHFEQGVESHRRAADEITAALELDPSLSLRDVGTALGISHTTVSRLLKWRKSGADRTTTPFGGDPDRLGRAVKQAFHEQPDLIISEAVKDLGAARRLVRDLKDGIRQAVAAKFDVAEPPRGDLSEPPVLRRHLDTIVLDEHVLFVGDSTNARSKLEVLSHAGLPYLKWAFDPDAIEEGDGGVTLNAVVVTDPPYGQFKREITNDHRANWREVYDLFKPRGGFAFCAFHPPYFRAAETGIRRARGTPTQYLLLAKNYGNWWGDDHGTVRVRNLLEGIIYFTFRGESPWVEDRHIDSMLLSPDPDPEAKEDLRVIADGHKTPKPINVLIDLIGLITERGDIVLDPFAGSGTALIACHRMGRRFIGVEWEPAHAEKIVRAWQRETGGDAIVHREFADGPITFSELEQTPDWGDFNDPEWLARPDPYDPRA